MSFIRVNNEKEVIICRKKSRGSSVKDIYGEIIETHVVVGRTNNEYGCVYLGDVIFPQTYIGKKVKITIEEIEVE